MSIVNYQPRDLFDELLGDFFGGLPTKTPSRSAGKLEWKPAVNIKEQEDMYVVSADLPGVSSMGCLRSSFLEQ